MCEVREKQGVEGRKGVDPIQVAMIYYDHDRVQHAGQKALCTGSPGRRSAL